jgi:hypothetical protein
MGIQNKLVPVLDQPTYEFLKGSYIIGANGANGSICFRKDLKDRYYYYNNGAGNGMYRNDLFSDSVLTTQIGLPPYNTSNTAVNLNYSNDGYKGQVITASSNKVSAAFVDSKPEFVGKKIRIYKGKGINQVRTITSISAPVTEEKLVPTASSVGVTWAAAQFITDSTKNWPTNRWMGYEMKILIGAGTNSIRKILSNGPSNIHLTQVNLAGVRQDWGQYLPVAISTTAGSQSIIGIQYSEATIDSPWDVVPDKTSFFEILDTECILYASAQNGPWNLVKYDLVSNVWYNQTVNNMTPSSPTDFTMDSFCNTASGFTSGIVTSATTTEINDTGANWVTGDYRNMLLSITSGVGAGQYRVISGNTNSKITLHRPFDTAPNSSSQYYIGQDSTKVYMQTNTSQKWFIYNEDEDVWMPNNYWYDKGYLNNILLTPTGANVSGFEPIPISTITRAGGAGTFTTVRDHLLSSGDIGVITGCTDNSFNQSFTFTGAASVNTLTAALTGTVAATASNAFSATQVFDLSKNWATNQWSGHGLLLVQSAVQSSERPTSIVRKITSNTSNSLTVNAMASAPSAGARYYIVNLRPAGVDVTDGTTADKDGYGTCTASSAAGVITDSTKNWTTNIHAGKRVAILAGTSSFTETTITSNTATALTTAATSTSLDTTSVYAILGNSRQTLGGTNIMLNCVENSTQNPGKYIYYNAGSVGTSAFKFTFLRYNVTTEQWEGFLPNIENQGQSTPFLQGAQTTYDFKDRLYFTYGGNNQQCGYIDLNNFKTETCAFFPFTSNNNNFSRIKTFPMYRISDDLIFLYFLLPNTSQSMRTLIYT